MKRKVIITICIMLVIFNAFTFTSFGTVVSAPIVTGDSAVLINGKTGEILYDKNKDVKQYPASTTKIMTALLAIEKLSPDEMVTVSHNASFTEGSRIFLLEGEQMSVHSLLYALMLESANDAAIALAEHMAGSVEDFAVMMNERAEEMGAANTNFITPNGLPHEEHTTTAYDLALIAQEAMKNEEFKILAGTYNYTIPPTNLQPESRHLYSSNRLLYDTEHTAVVDGVSREIKYEGATGIKTGYTDAAQSCIVGGAKRNGLELIGVVLHSNASDVYGDIISLLEFGFNGFSQISIVKPGDILAEAKVKRGSSKKAELTVSEEVFGMVEAGSEDSPKAKGEFSYTISVYEMTAPFDAGVKAGTLTLYHGTREAGTYDLVTVDAVGLSSWTKFMRGDGDSVSGFQIVMLMLIVAVIAYLSAVGAMRRKHAREKAQRMARRRSRRESYSQSGKQSAAQIKVDNIVNTAKMEEYDEFYSSRTNVVKRKPANKD